MARNKVMTLWSAFVTAFLALCTALGLITTTAAAAVPQTETPRNSDRSADSNSDSALKAHLALSVTSPWALAYAKALPPTMKQRIGAEAHGKSPSCRHGALTDGEAATPDVMRDSVPDAAHASSPDAAKAPAAQTSAAKAPVAKAPAAKVPAAASRKAITSSAPATTSAPAATSVSSAPSVPNAARSPECEGVQASLELSAQAL